MCRGGARSRPRRGKFGRRDRTRYSRRRARRRRGVGGRRRRRPRRWRARLPRGPRSIRGCPRRTPRRPARRRARRDNGGGSSSAAFASSGARRRAIEAVGEGDLRDGERGRRGWLAGGRSTGEGARARPVGHDRHRGSSRSRTVADASLDRVSRVSSSCSAWRYTSYSIASAGSPWRPRALGVVARRARNSDSFKPTSYSVSAAAGRRRPEKRLGSRRGQPPSHSLQHRPP